MVDCPKCGGSVVESILNLDVYLKEDKVGTLTDVAVFSCTACNFDAFVLQVEVTHKGVFIGRGNKDGYIS